MRVSAGWLELRIASSADIRMYFKLEYSVSDLSLVGPDGHEFGYGGPHDLKVSIRPISEDERKSGHRATTAMCTASLEIQAKPSVVAIFQKIAANGFSVDVGPEHQTYRGPDGSRVTVPRLRAFPDRFVGFVNGASQELSHVLRRTIEILRWRTAMSGSHNPFGFRDFRWSVDGKFWHPVPYDGEVHLVQIFPVRLTNALEVEIDGLVKAGVDVPLHHALFRESWAQRFGNTSSSIVIGIAAAEIAVKACIASLAPDSEWLVVNLPTPPLKRLLTEYLPQLNAKSLAAGTRQPLPDEIVEAIAKGVVLRNQIAHVGVASPPARDVERILLAVRDLLWLVDYYRGNTWAWEHIRPEVRSRMENAIRTSSN